MHRPTVGLIALALIGVSTLLWLAAPLGGVEASGPLFRIGIVLAALWLALPELQRVSKHVLVGVLVLGMLMALQPRLFVVAILVGLAVAILRPRIQFDGLSRPGWLRGKSRGDRTRTPVSAP